MKFTKEEIELCRRILGKYRKPIKYGDWYYATIKKEYDIWTQESESAQINSFAIWTISDCLEFFRERALSLENLGQTDEDEYTCCICETDDLGLLKHTARWFEGKTPLEACLKAVLAVAVLAVAVLAVFEEEE